MKKIVVFILLLLVFSLPVRADEIYDTQYDNVGADRLENSLDDETKEFFDDNDIDAKDPNWVNKITNSNVLSHIWGIITGGLKLPLKSGTLIASVIFLTASITAFSISSRYEMAIYAAVLVVCAFIATDIWQSVEAAVTAVKGCSSFMLSFVPIFASVLALSGHTVTAPAMGALLLGASEVVSFIASFFVLPLMGGYLALSIASGVSPLLNNAGIVESIKKISMWVMSLLGTIFVGILSIQTVVNSAADSVTIRTTKFILGTSVPVVGSVLGESISTISASMGLLRSSIGIYGVVALGFMLLPIIVELLLWRFVLMLNISLSEMFTLPKIAGILRAVDSMLSVLLGVILIVGGMFIISLTVVITAGKA